MTAPTSHISAVQQEGAISGATTQGVRVERRAECALGSGLSLAYVGCRSGRGSGQNGRARRGLICAAQSGLPITAPTASRIPYSGLISIPPPETR